MNDLGMTLVWCAVQVTLVAGTGAALVAVAARRGPGAAASAARLALAFLLLLTPLAFCPLPSWWAWNDNPVSPERQAPPGPDSPADSASGELAPLGEVAGGPDRRDRTDRHRWPLAFLRRLRTNTARAEVAPAGKAWSWPEAVALVLLAGGAAGLVRLLFGLGAVRACRRRSQQIADPSLNQLAEALCRQMGCRRRVELRESAELAGPATVGWRRPAVLLPADWPAWDDAERRAVLAHEIAHVCRADYAAGLLARLGAALHFYHPLVHWLAGRLRLEQELAADALGARFAGGRQPYLLVLARMALRQDGRPVGWPASAFLSGPGTLMRRIHMLRTKNLTPDLPPRWAGRVLAAALLAGAGLAATALRGADGPPAKESGPRAEAAAPKAENAPFDLTYAAADGADGVFAFRPAALLRRPGMKPHVDAFNKVLAEGFAAEFKVPKELCPPVEDIEQIVAGICFRATKDKDGQERNAVLCDGFMLRTTRDFDWKKLMQALAKDVTEVKHGERVYYKTAKGALPMIWPLEVCFHLPDARTIVFHMPEEQMRGLIEKVNKGGESRFAKTEGWKRVERGLLALALGDHRDKDWVATLRKREDHGPAVAPLFENAKGVVFGVEDADDLRLRAFVTAADDAGAKKVAEAVEALLALGRAELAKDVKEKERDADDELEQALLALSQALLKNARTERDGPTVRWRSGAKVDWVKLVAAWMADKK